MADRLTVHLNGDPIYDIVLTDDFSTLAEELLKLGSDNRRVCIVTDSNVAKYHLEDVKKVLGPACKVLISHVIPAGEEHKTLDEIRNIYETLILSRFDRKDLLVALGGGVVGDMTGFTAATYLRGIDFVQIPTTMLSQVDSSIGGKTGVDFDSYKNMVGAFKMPKLVYMNLSTLKTMEEKAYLSGMGEVIKHGMIKDAQYFCEIKAASRGILERDTDTLLPIIRRSCEIKRDVVEKDPTEKGERALLNFGHTLGHAIEKSKNFTMFHGDCVALGCVAAARISERRGMITEEELAAVRDTFSLCGLPVTDSGLDPEEIIESTKNDKKMDAGVIRFILLRQIGEAYIDRTVTADEMRDALEYLSGSEEMV